MTGGGGPLKWVGPYDTKGRKNVRDQDSKNNQDNSKPGWADLIVTSRLSKGACGLKEEQR